MKCLFLTLFSFLFSLDGICQFDRIPVNVIYERQVKKFLVWKDSVVEELDFPQIEVYSLAIKFTDAFYNKESKEVRLIGKVYFKDTSGIGLSSVSIFMGCRNAKKKLIESELIDESKEDNENNQGVFDFIFKVKENESLFFFMPNFYLVEFKLRGLENDLLN